MVASVCLLGFFNDDTSLGSMQLLAIYASTNKNRNMFLALDPQNAR